MNNTAQVDQLAHIRELAGQSPFGNRSLVELGISYDGFLFAGDVTNEVVETAKCVCHSNILDIPYKLGC